MTKLTNPQRLAGAAVLLLVVAALRAQTYTFRVAGLAVLGLGAYRLSQQRLAPAA